MDIIKIEIIDKNQLCPACLCIGRTLHTINDDKVKEYYLEILNEIPVACADRTACPRVCWECAARLRAGVLLRAQVQDCCRILYSYTLEKLSECLTSEVCRPPRLCARTLPVVTIAPGTDSGADSGPAAGGDDTGTDSGAVLVKDEGPRDWENVVKPEEGATASDAEQPSHSPDRSDSPSREAATDTVREGRSTRAARQRETAARPSKRRGRGKETDGAKVTRKDKEKPKIVRVELTYEELQAERAATATTEEYSNTPAPRRCGTCLLAFRDRSGLDRHRHNRHRPELGRYACPVCQTVLATVDALTQHYRRHLTRYSCTACGAREASRAALRRRCQLARCRRAPTDAVYTCRDCPATAKSSDALRYHRERHAARAQCGDCDKTYTHRAGLLNHRTAVHKLHNAFPCGACDKVFRWKTSLAKHMEKHDKKGPATAAAHCAACGVTFASVCSLKRHLTHSLRHVTADQHKFMCDHCSRRFANKTKLRDHIEEKHLHRTYRCHICHKPSKNRVCLDQHVRNVHRGRPHDKMCHHCGKGFPTTVQLESHIRSHTGERPFICEVCPTTFSQQSNLYKHYRQVHLNIKSKRPAAPPPPPDPPHPAQPPHPVAVLTFTPQKQLVVQYDAAQHAAVL